MFTMVPIRRAAMCGKMARYICRAANTSALKAAATLSAGMSDIGPDETLETISKAGRQDVLTSAWNRSVVDYNVQPPFLVEDGLDN